MSENIYQSMRIDTAPTAAELQQMREAVEAPRQSAPVQVNTGGGGRITFSNGGERVEAGAMETLRATVPSRRPGMVMIPGAGETTREAAIAAGLITEDGDGEANPDPDPARQQAASGAERQRDVVDGTLWDAAEKGEIPANLPAGVTAQEAQTVWDGYAAQAEATLGEIGGTVALLSEMLNERELAQARLATFTKDHGWLQALGQVAQQRLANLPDQDPQAFRELIDTLPPEWRSKVTNGERGWRIDLAQHGTRSWGAAVRGGFVKF